MGNKKYDIVIFGASGFTGQFVVEEVGRVSEEIGNLKYAVAGRNKEKLEKALQNANENTGLDFSNVDSIIVDVNDKESLVSMASQTKLVMNCVGPYRFHGVKVVEACIEGGADHVDISGEPQYLEEVQLMFSEKAKEKGIHIVGSCGFDSVPADMGTVYLQNNFGGDINSIDMIVGYQDDSEGNAPINVTTLESALHGYASRKELGKIRKELFKTDKPPKSPYRLKPRGTVWWSDDANRWCLPNMASDRSVVLRTQALNYRLYKKRAVQFNAFFGMKSIWTVLGAIMFGFIFTAMAPLHSLGISFLRLFSFGMFSREGAKREELKKMKFLLTFVAEGWDSVLSSPEEQHPEPPSVRKIGRVCGPDPGYFGTATVFTQCAVTILKEKDFLPERGGVFTPGAAFLKTSLIERLQSKGIKFKIVS